MSSSAHIDNKKKDILMLGKGPTQGLEHTSNAVKMYTINFTVTKKNCLSLHYNRANILKDWSVDNMKKNRYVYDFSVDYDATDVDDILDIQKCFCILKF